MRRFPAFGFLLAVLCLSMAFASVASAGDAYPGKLLYAKGVGWRSEISLAAPLDTKLTFDLNWCIPLGPNPCQHVTLEKGGAVTFDSKFARDWIAGPDIGVVDAPPGVWTASSFLAFDATHTAFTAPLLRWVLSSSLDDFRAAVAARTDSASTCTTFFNDSDSSTGVQIVTYGADGQRATDKRGGTPPIDVYYLPPRTATQACLGDWYKPDGSLYALGPTFSAGSVRIAFGCAGLGACPSPQKTWFVVTKGPASGATIETLPVQNVGPVEGAAASIRAESADGAPSRGELVHLHGPAPAPLVDAVDQHNADITRRQGNSKQ